MIKSVSLAAAVTAAFAFAAPAAQAEPICNTTTGGGETAVTVCADPSSEAYFEWCLDWSFPCQRTTVDLRSVGGLIARP